MIRIKVTSSSGLQPPRVCDFDQNGGTIGRSDNNHLVLPDPERYISRLHARILYKDGNFVFIDEGNNPTQVNGTPLGKGNSFALQVNDELQIGDYNLVVEDISTAVEMPPALEAGATDMAPTDVNDPLGLRDVGLVATPGNTAGKAVPADPLADLLGQAAPVVKKDEGRAGGAPVSPQGIPDDFDPFADSVFAQPTQDKSPPGWPLPTDFFGNQSTPPQASGKGSIDSLFGLGAKDSKDPFAGSVLGEGPTSNTRGSGDFLSALEPKPPGGAASVPDNSPEIHSAYVPPVARLDRKPPPHFKKLLGVSEPPDPTSPQDRKEPEIRSPQEEMFVSWETDEKPGATGISQVVVEAREPYIGEPSPAAVAHGPRGKEEKPGTGRPSPVAPNPAESATAGKGREEKESISQEALLQALLKGLDMESLPALTNLTPEVMERIGCLLKEATQGTLDLLLARAMTKREVKAAVTMISSRDNNPLKFSPDAASALSHLLAPQGQGFLPPVKAMRDAYNDLRAHQFGFMAGMRAALNDVLARFNPQTLEKSLIQKSMLDSVLPMNRRAKLWELYIDLYQDIASEAEEDFHSLFGREFLRAYQEQVAQMDNNPQPGEKGKKTR